jgi:hypothetical protein
MEWIHVGCLCVELKMGRFLRCSARRAGARKCRTNSDDVAGEAKQGTEITTKRTEANHGSIRTASCGWADRRSIRLFDGVDARWSIAVEATDSKSLAASRRNSFDD